MAIPIHHHLLYLFLGKGAVGFSINHVIDICHTLNQCRRNGNTVTFHRDMLSGMNDIHCLAANIHNQKLSRKLSESVRNGSITLWIQKNITAFDMILLTIVLKFPIARIQVLFKFSFSCPNLVNGNPAAMQTSVSLNP